MVHVYSKIGAWSLIGIYLVLLLFIGVVDVQANNARSVYYMDKRTDCDYIGTWFVGRDQTIKVIGRSSGGAYLSGCTINFKAVDSDANLEVKFLSYALKSCQVYIYLSGDGTAEPRKYGCDENDPRDFFTIGRGLTFTVHKIDVTTVNYNFTAQVIAKRDNVYPPPGDSNPAAVGMVIGIVGSIFIVIIVISCIGVCCFRKYRAKGPTHSPYLHDPNSKVKLEDTPTSNGGYFNESARFTGSPMAKKKLLSHSDSSDDRTNSDHSSRQRGFSSKSNSNIPAPPPPPPPSGDKTPNGRGGRDVFTFENDRQLGRNHERGVDVDSQPRNSMLSALHGNKKFKDTYKATEADAEERAKRISSSSSFENFGEAPSPPSSRENMSRPSLPPVPKSPKGKKQKTAGINRIPRPTSMSSEELEEIERGRPRDDDHNIRVMHHDSSSASSEVVPIKLSEQNKKKTNTTHSLRPDRKAPKGKNRNQSTSSTQNQQPNKRETQSVSSVFDPEPRPSPREHRHRGLGQVRDLDRLNDSCDSRNSSGRFNKKARKSPRTVRSGRGFSHRRGRSVDQLDSRPVTPTSAFGSMEDLESLPPLQRASSKNSLYASRSSLYDRRRRRGSTTESVHSMHSTMRGTSGYSSYSDEDFDGYEKPLSRRDKERLYRSENDLGRGRREISTQTLRETATQTGAGEAESVIMQPKMLVKKKKKSRNMSTSGTQTEKKKSDVKKAKSKAEEKMTNRGETAEKRKSKRSKSLNALDVETDESPKPKPKPRPRKSTSTGKVLDTEKRSASADNLLKMQENPYNPPSEGFVPTGYNPAAPYPMMPPGYPAPPYPGQPPYMGQYPPQQMQGGPPGYMPHMYPQQQQFQQPPMNSAVPQNKPTPPRKKSNWEILCEMTDGEYQRDDVTETGSVASSVFTHNPHSANTNYAVQAGPQPPYLTNTFPAQQYGQPAYHNGAQQNYKQAQPSQPAGNQSSWEALRSMTEPSIQQPSQQQTGMRRNESVV